MMSESNDLIRRLQSFIREVVEDIPTIVAVYLFGSYAIEKAKVVSDLDLAFFFDEGAYKKDPFGVSSSGY